MRVGEFLAEGIKKRRLEMTIFFSFFLFFLDSGHGQWQVGNFKEKLPPVEKVEEEVL